MARDGSLRGLRSAYALLLKLYPRSYRERFGEPMLQTFHDLLRERAAEGRNLFRFTFWMFAETLAATLRENGIMITLHRKPLVRIVLVTVLILIVPLVANQTVEGFDWGLFDFVVIGAVLFGTGLAYHLVASRLNAITYRVAVGLALAAAFVLFWMNAAAGIIGGPNEDLANLLYVGGVLAVGFIGALLARLRPRGMAWALFAMALTQALVAGVALAAGWGAGEPVWPWGFAILTGIFVTIWVGSALLFLRASRDQPMSGELA
ncbi:MAG TPA: hypothetical protein VMR74_10480 [Gammaproteobacteria bacterium]|nr:hypothetical protein [Gammaproteobacteria bacterium]